MAADAVRLFLGVRVSMKTVDELVDMTQSMAALATRQKLPVRWVPAGNFHITVQFLGWTRKEAIYALEDACEAAALKVRPFNLEVRGVGAFPSPQRATVQWAGAGRGAEDVTELAGVVHAATGELGFAADKRPFHPHLTVARFKKPTDATPLTTPFSNQRAGTSKVDALVLWESQLSDKGATYVRRAEWPLG